MKKCENCSKLFKVKGKKKNGKQLFAHPGSIQYKETKYCSRKCYLEKAQSGYWAKEKSSHWKGGKIDRSGYTYIRIGERYVAEHRIVMEKIIGRKLKKSEVIHHIDHNKKNNSPKNLKLYESTGKHSIAEHIKFNKETNKFEKK